MNTDTNVIAENLAVISSTLDYCGIDGQSREKLLSLTADETAAAFALGVAEDFDGAPLGLGKLAKLVRLSGEMPLYTALITAMWFKKSGTTGENIRKAVETDCGISFEREFVQLVAEAFSRLPDLRLDDENVAKAKIIKSAYRKGYNYEKTCRGCAQCTMAAVSDITGRENLEMFRAANGFAAGMALLGDGVCGGYSGGLLSLGMFAGRRREFFDGDKEEKDLNALLATKLHDKFIETYGTVICHGIHSRIFGRAFNITVPEEKEAFEQAGAHSLDKCPAVVGTAAAYTAEILIENGFINHLQK